MIRRGKHWREAKTVAERYADGEPLSKIAKDYDKSKNTIKAVVESTGEKMRGRGGNNHKQKYHQKLN